MVMGRLSGHRRKWSRLEIRWDVRIRDLGNATERIELLFVMMSTLPPVASSLEFFKPSEVET